MKKLTLKAVRNLVGMKQNEVKEKLGVGINFINEMENGIRILDKEMRKKVCELYNFKEEEIEFENQDKPNEITSNVKNGIDIKTARINCGIKIKDISDKLGINIGTMSNYENGLKIPKEIFKKLCKEYHVKEEEIVANVV